MGLRVRVVLVVLSLLAIAALAVPLALSLADRRTAALTAERDRQLAALADSAAVPDAPLERLIDRYFDVYEEGVVVVDADGRTLASRGLSDSDPGVAASANRALADAPATPLTRILPWDRRTELAATGVRNDGELVGAVVMAVDTSAATRGIAIGWMWVAAGCLALVVVAALIGRAITRWVLRPLDGLERAVAEMTRGVSGPPADVAGPPELRHFTSAFNTMAQVVRASLDRQRRLVADASHQLRNPLAAVRLRADSLDDYVSEAGRSTYESMTGELDRLENLLQQLLRLARAEEVSNSRRVGLTTTAETTALDDVIVERMAFWKPVADGQHQRLHHRADHPGLTVQLARHDAEQLLDVAVDNALRYAGPDTTVTVSTARAEDVVELIVSDDGAGLPDDDLVRAAARFWRGCDDGAGTGLGLAIAGEIATGHGGGISVEKAPEGGLLVRFSMPEAGAST
ncbi:sensor histidine kinase [Mycolicibacterium sp. P9-64]|uniref:sensor histidine kinase n=1 Tax=Mycolicibacterium sp. P9-64 TaxID=2024612 RepID=UPI0011EBA923|nr:ATP-binding protein [Mycolicibacterium sp. P9-64]KAA0081812.1 sensor histidine kinase [Mycolicibacterium sp. P9-64]